MSDLPRKAAARTARLAALPLGYAGRTALGLGRRIGGAPADVVLSDVQQRTAEQLFRTLGELKGGAMKFGQAMSIFEAALPEDLAAPYRAHLTRLQDSAPPMPTATVRGMLAEGLGPEWADHVVDLDPEPAAAASIGQVHRARWRDEESPEGIDVAVKVQYPSAGAALRSDLRQLSRLARGLAPMVPGIDVKPLLDELQDRAVEELDYRLEAEAQSAFAAAYADNDSIVVPRVVAGGDRMLVTEWLDSEGSLARIIRDGTRAERDHYGRLFLEFLFTGPERTGLLHADPHPGNFRPLPRPDGSPGRLGILDFGAVARLPRGRLPRTLGAIIRIAAMDDYDALVHALREEEIIRSCVDIDPASLRRYLGPFMQPAAVEEFSFSRHWMRDQFQRINDPRNEDYKVALRLNLPPSYMLIHRTFTGAIGVLSQLGATVPFRQLLTDHLPGFAE